MILCPRDGNELVEHVSSAHPVWLCNVCSGAFILNLPVAQLRSRGTKQAREEWDIEINCPEHHEKMEFVTVDGMAIDFCPKCFGVWLDGGEIKTVLGRSVSNEIFPPPSSPAGARSAWSEVDFLSPLIDALLNALSHHQRLVETHVWLNPSFERICAKNRAGRSIQMLNVRF